MDQITRTIKITLVGHYWDLIPEYTVHCNKERVCRKELVTASGQEHVEEFVYSGDITTLRIGFLNKASDQSVLNLGRTRILRDMLLEIRDVSIDGKHIDLINRCVYRLDQKQTYRGELVSEIKGVNVLGWNGVLEISIP